MKKEYISPEMETVLIAPRVLNAVSSTDIANPSEIVEHPTDWDAPTLFGGGSDDVDW